MNTKLKSITWTYNLMNDNDVLKLATQIQSHTNSLTLDFSNNAITDISPFTAYTSRITSWKLKGNNLYNTTGNQQVITALGSKLEK